MRIGIVINNFRIENGLSMDKFAKKAGISKAYVGFLESGKHPKTGKPLYPSIDMIKKCASAMGMTFDELFHMLDEDISITSESASSTIPVLGRVAAGIPIDAIEEVIEFEEISSELAKKGDFFGLKIKGDSMEPRIYDGDTVIVLQTSTAESGDIVIASTDESDAVCKRFVKKGKLLLLRSLNPDYEDINVTNDPGFHILGIVVEMRGKLKNI